MIVSITHGNQIIGLNSLDLRLQKILNRILDSSVSLWFLQYLTCDSVKYESYCNLNLFNYNVSVTHKEKVYICIERERDRQFERNLIAKQLADSVTFLSPTLLSFVDIHYCRIPN